MHFGAERYLRSAKLAECKLGICLTILAGGTAAAACLVAMAAAILLSNGRGLAWLTVSLLAIAALVAMVLGRLLHDSIAAPDGPAVGFGGVRLLGADVDRPHRHTALDAALNALATGVIVMDGRGEVVFWNRAIGRMFGQPDLQQAQAIAITPPFEQALAAMDGCGSGREEIELRDGTVLALATERLPCGGLVQSFADITELRRTERQLARLADRDAVTELYNYRAFRATLARACREAETGDGFALVLIDIDAFGAINAALDYAGGDKLLRQVGRRICGAVRGRDTVARLEADVFALLLPGLTSRPVLAARCKQIAACLRDAFEIDGRPIAITACAEGILCPDDAIEPNALLERASRAIGQAKSQYSDPRRPWLTAAQR